MKCQAQIGDERANQLLRQAELREERGDFKGAFGIHMAAAKLGNIPALLCVGNYYSAGRSVARDLEEAARWYKRAYRSGDRCGAYNLAIDLQKHGKKRGAIAWLKRAVAMNDGDACVELAKIYLEGRNGAKPAAILLRKALSLSCADTSDQAREDAEVLLMKIARSQRS